MSLRLTERQLAAIKGGKPVPQARRGEVACDILAVMLNAKGIAFTREYRFCAGRRFRFDFALHIHRLAVEVDGQVHRIENRYNADREKFNLAMMLRWRVLHVTPFEVRNGSALDLILKVIAS